MEWRILICGLTGAVGWWLGGRGVWPGKAWRRYIYPLVCGVVLWPILPPLRLVLGVGLLITANSLGYGEGDPKWKRVLVALTLGVCLLPFGVIWWQAGLVSVWFLVNYLLSRLSNRHSWAFVETTTGAVQGAVAGMAT